jgi:hypothetical protein
MYERIMMEVKVKIGVYFYVFEVFVWILSGFEEVLCY